MPKTRKHGVERQRNQETKKTATDEHGLFAAKEHSAAKPQPRGAAFMPLGRTVIGGHRHLPNSNISGGEAA
jgi:hypothetical protein